MRALLQTHYKILIAHNSLDAVSENLNYLEAVLVMTESKLAEYFNCDVFP